MALVSPGIEISVNDQSQYVNSNVGSVPLVILATAQDKTYNGAPAIGTSAAYAGKLQSFTSQRDLVTALGAPMFQTSSSGTPVNAAETNEYGLLTAYSALGLGNQLYAIRANIDLDQLNGTSIRPTGDEADGTYWLNLAATEFGIYSLNSSTSSFTSIDSNLLLITDPGQVVNDSNYSYPVQTPISTIGNPGQYALVFANAVGSSTSITNAVRLFYKITTTSVSGNVAGALNNTWCQVGSTIWQNSVPAVQGTTTSPTITNSSTLQINGSNVTVSTGSLTNLVTAINNAAITGVSAAAINNQLTFFVTSAAASGAGTLSLVDGANTPLAASGIKTLAGAAVSTVYGSPSVFYCPYFFYGTFAQTPSGGWFSTDTQPRPSGSLWWKTTATGGGFNPVFSQYSAANGTWNQLAAPLYSNYGSAIYGLDPLGGGVNLQHGQIIATYNVSDYTSNMLRFAVQLPGVQSVGTGGIPTAFTIGNSFTLTATQLGTSATNSATITLSATTSAGFVSAIQAAAIPYVTAALNANGTISITHTTGGQINLVNVSGTPLTNAGFANNSVGSGFRSNNVTGAVVIGNFSQITSNIQYSKTTPYASPTNGTLWYYSNPADVDIMINNNGWKGYRTVTSDIRGYNLTNTDITGVIISPSAPTSQVSGASLVAGDLWLNSGDLVNYPNLSRYNGTAWVAINNQDHVSNNGIIFADARWDNGGGNDPVSAVIPVISDGVSQGLLFSSWIDQDAPDYRLYPRGTLLFNTRRSGFNVKKFVQNYFSPANFPNPGTTPGTSGSLPSVVNSWVSASGLDPYGVMYAGSDAQRALVVAAMKSALDSNTDVIESNYQFNLLCAPGYPELIPNLVALNDNRGDTGFIIGDTPITLQPTATELTNWSNNTGDWAGLGLATASPYLAVYYPAGQTTDLSGNTVVVPASHAALRTYLYNDNVAYPWFAPAGTHRGLVNNLSDIGYVNQATGAFIHNGINQGLRDALYEIDINPITQLPGVGLVIWGQETRSGDSTSRNRVNVVRLENYLRRILNTISNGFLFEPNDTITRKSIATQIESALNNIVSHRGIYDFLVICDTSNNTPSVIANNQLYVDVAIEPMKDVEFIYIPIALYNPGTIAALGATST